MSMGAAYNEDGSYLKVNDQGIVEEYEEIYQEELEAALQARVDNGEWTQEQLDALKTIDFSDHSLFVDKYCADNCYLFNICPNCYGANYLVNGKFNERDKSRCNLVKLQAYYASALQAQKIIAKGDNIEESEKNKVALQIRAIEKINEICQKELFTE